MYQVSASRRDQQTVREEGEMLSEAASQTRALRDTWPREPRQASHLTTGLGAGRDGRERRCRAGPAGTPEHRGLFVPCFYRQDSSLHELLSVSKGRTVALQRRNGDETAYCCSVTQSRPTLCNPMECSTPGLPELAQTHDH